MSEINEDLKKELGAYIQLAATEYIKCLEGSSASARFDEDQEDESKGGKNKSNIENNIPKNKKVDEDLEEEPEERTPDVNPVDSSFIKIKGFSDINGEDFESEKASISESNSVKLHNKVWSNYSGDTEFNIMNSDILEKVRKQIHAKNNKKINLVGDQASFGTFILIATSSDGKKYAGVYTVTIINHNNNNNFLKIKCKLSTRENKTIPTTATQVGTRGVGDPTGILSFEFEAKKDKLYAYSSVDSTTEKK